MINIDEFDRIDTNPENKGTYYGIDCDDGTTMWYDESGNIDSITETPEFDDDYQHRIYHDGEDGDD